MNDPKDIILDISIEKDILAEEKNEITLTEENRFNNLLSHLKENLYKRLYKKTLKEIESLIEIDNIEKYSHSWKLYIIRIRAYLSIIKNKIIKYIIDHTEKFRINHHINTIKKYFNKVQIELEKFYKINKDIQIHENTELINDLLICYLDYILLISYFNKKLGNTIDSIGYLSLIIRLYKETKLVPKTKSVCNKMEMCFIALINLLICNNDYFTAFEYLNILMDMCLKDIIYQSKDISDGVRKFDKDKYKYDISDNDLYEMSRLKGIVLNIIYVFLYRSICYENIGKMINAVKCDYQSIWFLNHFYVSNYYKYFYYLIKSILSKRIEFQNAINFIDKKIKYLEQKQRNKKSVDDSKEERGHLKKSNSLFSLKFKNLVNKLDNLKIPEIDLVNKFEEKKNLKGLNSINIEGKDKNNFLYGIRLFNTYLREDFRPIIDSMQKIKSFDIDYQTQEKIQKYVRKLYFDQNQRNIKLNSHKKHKNNFNISLPSFKTKKIKIKKNILNKRIMSTKNTRTRILSSIGRSNSLPDETMFKSSSTKNKTVNILKNLNKNEPLDEIKEIKESPKRKIPKYKVIKLTSICDGHEVYKENEELNKFFNKKYLAKRAYIKKLEERELLFQKYVLKGKNTPKIPFIPYNKELIKRKAENNYQKILSLSVASTPYWKENISKEEYHRIKVFNRLENTAIFSLENNALIRYKEEERKMRKNKYITLDENDNSKLKIEKGNKSMIEKININLEEINQRESIENKNFKKLYNENKKYIKHRNERNSSFLRRKEREKEENQDDYI